MVINPDTVYNLQELNVIAIKQTENLNRTAVSSTVIGMTELENLNAAALKSISDVVPNFYIPEYGSRITSSMYVRGIGARIDQPAVGLNVDNVPYLNKNTYDFDLADIASVEMLRGPQSTLYGRNTIGGLINITTISPLYFQGWRLMAQGGSGNDWKASAGWYHKFNPKTATAITGYFSYLGGFFRNLYTGKLLDREINAALRWKLDARPTEAVEINNVLAGGILRQGGYPYEYVETGEINYNDTCYYHRFTLNDGLSLKWKNEKFEMTSITSLQYLDDNMTLDQDFLPLPYFTLQQKQHEWAVTEDLLFRGKAAEGKYKWLAGAFGFFKHLSMHAPVLFKEVGIESLIVSHRNEANPGYPIGWDSDSFPLNSDFTVPTGGVAIYHESEYKTGNWKFTAGLRLDWEQATLNYRSQCDTGYEIYHRENDGALNPYRHVDINIDDRGKLRHNYFNWMPKVSVLYFLPEKENNVYASVSRGYKAGGFNTQMFSDVLQQKLMGIMGLGSAYDTDKIVSYKPEYSWNYEIGAHFRFPAAGLSADLSAFYIDCTDQQLTMYPSGTTTGRVMTNAGHTRSIGAEVTLDWSLINNLNFVASYGYTNAKFVKFFDGIENYKGKYLPYAPQNTFFASLQYRFPFTNEYCRALMIEANTRGAGKIYWNESNSVWQDFYLLLGASATLEFKKMSVQVWGKNLLNKDYYTFYFKSMGNEFLQHGRPLQAGITLRVEF